MKLLGSNGFISPVTMFSSEWRKPFNISIGLHIIVLVLAMLAPTLFDRQPRLPEIYTVNLYTATEVAKPIAPPAKTPEAKTAPKPAVRQIEPETKKPVVSIQPSKPEVVPAAKTSIAKPVSLKPLKQKIKVGKTKEEEARDRVKLDQVVQRLKTSAAASSAKAEADEAAKDAVSKLAEAMKTTSAATSGSSQKSTGAASSTTKTSGVSGPRGTGIEPEFYMKQYLSAVYQKIHDHWVLPDLQNWDNSARAVLVIIVRKDGVITKTFFEKKSNNIYFNQFIIKTVKDASPLPPFPDQLKENTYEIGLRFSPEGLY